MLSQWFQQIVEDLGGEVHHMKYEEGAIRARYGDLDEALDFPIPTA